MESVRNAVSNGLGFSLSAMKLDHGGACDSGRVVSVPIADDIDPLAVVLLRKQAAPVSAQVERFLSFCEKYLKEAEAC